MTLKYRQAYRVLKSHELPYDKDAHNKLRVHNKHETLQHYSVRALLFKILTDMGHHVFSEYPVYNTVVDLLDVETMLVYEVETNPRKNYAEKRLAKLNKGFEHVKDVICIDLTRDEFQTDDIIELTRALKKKVV